MITKILIDLYSRELDGLKEEIKAYSTDDQPWKISGGMPMAGGNLCLYLTGSLQHYIGAIIGDSGYIRNKEAELKARNISRERLLEEVAGTKSVVVDTLEQLSKNDLQKIFPTQEFEEPVTTEFYLIHLLNKFCFHLGQVQYHRKQTAAD